MTRLGRRLRLLLRRRSVQAGLVLLAVPAAWGTYRLAVPHYQGRPLSYWMGTLGDAAVTDPEAFCGQHSEPPQWWAFATLGRMGRVADALDDPDPSVRAGACRVLAGLGELMLVGEQRRSAIAKLIALLRDTDPRVRFHAAFALGASGDAMAVEPLLNAIQAVDADGRLKSVAAVSSYWLTDAPHARDVACRGIADALQDPAARMHAVRNIHARGWLWSPTIEQRLIRSLEESPGDVSAADDARYRYRVYRAFLTSAPATVDVRLAAALLGELCRVRTGDPVLSTAGLWLVDAAQGRNEPLARAVRTAVQQEGPAGHDCPLVRRGEPCGREAWHVKRLLESDR